MKNLLNIIPISLICAISFSEITEIVAVICSVLITLTSCFVNIYRLWRDKDKDLKGDNEDEKQH